MNKRELKKAQKEAAAIPAETATLYRGAIRQTWEVIAGDIANAAAECGESVDLEGAAEGALDYVYSYGRLAKPELEAFQAVDYHVRIVLAREALRGYV